MKQNNLAVRPIGLTMHCIAEYRVVNSVSRAAETLLQRWSIDDGEDFSEVVMVCLEGLHNRVPLEDVRAAFIKAAHEAIDADLSLGAVVRKDRDPRQDSITGAAKKSPSRQKTLFALAAFKWSNTDIYPATQRLNSIYP
ncbi:DUF982 domain-containing protein [Rhizobium sp. 007]|nr:DUF982 domain-containing protein [Rhizobium sp. 007]QPB23071.1 DUF982 domain-containing protein [Rhizobium sp. 007]